jgi:hypothetical protein
MRIIGCCCCYVVVIARSKQRARERRSRQNSSRKYAHSIGNFVGEVNHQRDHPSCLFSLGVEHCTCNAEVLGSIPRGGFTFCFSMILAQLFSSSKQFLSLLLFTCSSDFHECEEILLSSFKLLGIDHCYIMLELLKNSTNSINDVHNVQPANQSRDF